MTILENEPDREGNFDPRIPALDNVEASVGVFSAILRVRHQANKVFLCLDAFGKRERFVLDDAERARVALRPRARTHALARASVLVRLLIL